ncbi:WD40-repeat-containing domain protein [Mycotypha africana]|uniref:WD40-repeat-containing domain protein n=1 Tax=Mycotypha africana TaxID=64632 RepID=UPI002301A2B4|nr:WD40-repeat-containing domain protein [Mycotypha africana]KAI8991042.1 WD40-repeat-containing domain protein [Mycotypha africana]
MSTAVKAHNLISHHLSITPYDVKWIPSSSRVCVVGASEVGTGKISIYGLEGKRLELKRETETNTVLRCCTITGHSRQIATGDFDGQLQIWDSQRLDIPLISFKAHQSIINSIDSFDRFKDPQELVTGSRDGTVKVWDMRQTEKPVLTIRSTKKANVDIWAVAYGRIQTEKVIAVGFEDGSLKLFHVGTSEYIWGTKMKDGICSIDFVQDSLLVSTLSGAYTVELKSPSGKTTEIKTKFEKETTLWSIRHMPQNPDYFTIASGDGKLSTFNLNKTHTIDDIQELSLSKHPIISLDYNRDKKGLYACTSFDQTLRIGIVQSD